MTGQRQAASGRARALSTLPLCWRPCEASSRRIHLCRKIWMQTVRCSGRTPRSSAEGRLLRPKPCGTARAPSLTWLIAARPPARQFKPHDALHSYAQQDTTQGHTAVLTTPCGHPGLLRSSVSPSAGSALPPAQLFQFLFWREVMREGERSVGRSSRGLRIRRDCPLELCSFLIQSNHVRLIGLVRLRSFRWASAVQDIRTHTPWLSLAPFSHRCYTLSTQHSLR